MINIEFYNDGLLINGHANADEYNKDIYCAAVSAISQGALNWFNEEDVNYQINDGYLYLKIINKTTKNLELLELIKTQLLSLNSNDCKKYIKFNEIKKDIKNDK